MASVKAERFFSDSALCQKLRAMWHSAEFLKKFSLQLRALPPSEKTEGRKSRETVPLKTSLLTVGWNTCRDSRQSGALQSKRDRKECRRCLMSFFSK
jgi:hypothetical protein